MSKLAHSNNESMLDLERLRAIHDGITPTPRIPEYDSSVSHRHPLSHHHLEAIAQAYQDASSKGFYEHWMAVYNACVRQGKIAIEEAAIRCGGGGP